MAPTTPTYDDVNELVADGVSPDVLDTLYTKLKSVGIEVITHAEVEIGQEPLKDVKRFQPFLLS